MNDIIKLIADCIGDFDDDLHITNLLVALQIKADKLLKDANTYKGILYKVVNTKEDIKVLEDAAYDFDYDDGDAPNTTTDCPTFLRNLIKDKKKEVE